MAVERLLPGPYPNGVTSEKIGEWLLRGNLDASLPREGPADDEPLTPPIPICPRCGFPDDPGDDGLCHRLLCGGSLFR